MSKPGSSRCVFPECKKTNSDLKTSTSYRLQTIISASKSRGDNPHLTLEPELQCNPSLKVEFHTDCISTYTSKHHISRVVAKRGANHERSHSEPPIRRRRSEIPTFDF